MTHGITRRQQLVLQFIRDYDLEHGRCPSFQEICAGTGIKSKSNVHAVVVALEDRGKLRRLFGRSRSLELIPASPILTVEFPPDLYALVQSTARQAKVTPQAVVIEAVRDGFKHLSFQRRSQNVTRETMAPA